MSEKSYRREITVERSTFKNNNEWIYMLHQLGLVDYISPDDGISSDTTQIESVTFLVDIDRKPLRHGDNLIV